MGYELTGAADKHKAPSVVLFVCKSSSGGKQQSDFIDFLFNQAATQEEAHHIIVF